jgi:hypothetical protein
LGWAPGTARGVLRGGSWNNNPQNLRAARRNNNNPDNRNNNIGFRLAVGWQYDLRQNFQGYGSGERALFVQGRSRRSWPGQVVCARYRRGACPGLRATGAAGSFFEAGKNKPMRNQSRQNGPAIEAHFRFFLWLGPTVENFPRDQKFILGDRMQNTALDVLEALIEATYTRERRVHLARANLGLEKLRFFFRAAVEMQCVDKRRYEFAARSLDETGRLIGGWAKADAAHAEAA